MSEHRADAASDGNLPGSAPKLHATPRPSAAISLNAAPPLDWRAVRRPRFTGHLVGDRGDHVGAA